MKILRSFAPLFAALAILSAGVGCAAITRATLSPVYAPAVPGDTNAPAIVAYTVNTNAAIPQIVAGVQTVAPLVPAPVGTILGGLATLAGVSLAAFAKLRSIKADKLLNVVIAGVEAAGNADTKAKIQNLALSQGVQGALDAKVNP